MISHLDEVALEALATGRDELVSEEALEHLDGCESCASRVAEEEASVSDASLGLRRAMPELDDLDAMIARAMELAPEGADELLAGPAPTRGSLWMGAAIGGVVAVGLAVLSAPRLDSLSGLGTAGSQVLTLLRAADRVVDSTMPGGWIGVALAGLFTSLLLALPARLMLRSGGRSAFSLTGTMAALALGLIALPSVTAHAYRVDGAWPEPMPSVQVDVERRPVSEALQQAAESAGLGVVVHLEDDPPVTMHVRGVPIDEVVEALLGDRDVVVRPGASLITVRVAEPRAVEPRAVEPRAAEPEVAVPGPRDFDPPRPPAVPLPRPLVASAPAMPPIPPMPPTPPSAPHDGSAFADVVTLGDDAEVGSERHVRGVYTMGGDARVRGHAYGDVFTMGGNATIEGEVIGNVTTMGGDIVVGPEARIHGDLNAMGGEVEVHESAVLYGRIVGTGEMHSSGGAAAVTREHEDDPGIYRWALWNALLFLFGVIMLGSGRERFSNLRAELGARPVRSAIGGFFGLLAGGALATALTLSVLGIPGAVVLSVLMASGYVLGWGTSAWWLGSVLPIPGLKKRPVAELAVGVVLLFVVGLIPKVGTLLVIGAALAGLGAVIATSFGKKPRRAKARPHVPTGPFRTGA